MFFLLWSGWGFLVPVILGTVFVLMQAGLNAMIGPYTYESAEWPKFLATLITGVSIWFVGRYFNNKPGRVLIDKQTGHEVVFKPRNTFFFIPMEYWAFIIAVFGIILSFTN